MSFADVDTKKGFHRFDENLCIYLVPETGFEPARLAALDPKSSVSANFTTPAIQGVLMVPIREGTSKQFCKFVATPSDASDLNVPTATESLMRFSANANTANYKHVS